jgi:capsular polysaccharide transport system permease protein
MKFRSGTPANAAGPAGLTHYDRSTVATGTSEFRSALRNWYTVIAFLMIQYFGRSNRAGRLALLLVVAEPFLAIGMLYLIRGVIRGGTGNSYGDSYLLFLASGVMPYYIFVRTSVLVRSGMINPTQSLPRIRSLDRFTAHVAANALLYIFGMVVLFYGMWLYGIRQAMPTSIADCEMALVMFLILGLGFGLVNSAIARFFPLWLVVVQLLTRGIMFVSGVLRVSDFYSPSWRAFAVWNPVMHAVDWFRTGVYHDYPHMLMDRAYLIKFAIVLFFVGFVAERASLRYSGR